MGGQADSQVGSQVHESRKFHAYANDLRSTCVDLRWVAKAGENVRLLAYEFELDQSQRTSRQVGGQTKRKLNEMDRAFVHLHFNIEMGGDGT